MKMDLEIEEGPAHVLFKTDAIISVFEQCGECSAQQVAQETGEPLSSTYRLLSSLVAVEIVTRGSKRGLFRLGFFPMRIGSMLESQLDIRELGLPAMRILSQNSGGTVFLWVRRGDRAVCIERVVRRDVSTALVRLGDSLPLWSSSSGRALLAFLPSAEIADVVDNLRQWSSEPPDLEHLLGNIREQGYAFVEGSSAPGTVSIAAPIFNHRGELEAAVSISALSRWIIDDLEKAIASVTEAANEISRCLGRRSIEML